jgi:predicted acyltransferase (DUF342 family)
MREERGQIAGDVLIYEQYTLWGNIGGNVRVIQGGKFYVRGAVYGNITVEFGGRVHIFGNVTGKLILERGAKVIHSGVIAGTITNDGGRLFVDHLGKVMGKIKTKNDGETTIDPAAKILTASGKPVK